MRASRCLHTCSNALERGSSPSLLPQVIQALRLGFLAFMRIALATRCTDLYPLDGFGPDRTLLPPALPVYSLDISGTSVGRPPQRWVSLVAEPVARSWIRPNISPSRLGPNSILVVQFEVTHFVSQIPQTHYGYSISSEQTSTREAMVLILGRAEWMHLMLCLASYIAMNRLCQSVGPRE